MRSVILLMIFTGLLTTVACRPTQDTEDTESDSPQNEYEEEYSGGDDEPEDRTFEKAIKNKSNGITEDPPSELNNPNETEYIVCNNKPHPIKDRMEDKHDINEDKLYEDSDDENTTVQSNEKHSANIEDDKGETLQNKNANNTSKNGRSANIRENRQTKDVKKQTKNVPVTQKSDFENDIKNDEIIIKKQIKELSNTELDELLSSLSDDKRELLNKIIESSKDDDDNDTVNKREIDKDSETDSQSKKYVGNFLKGASRPLKFADVVTVHGENSNDTVVKNNQKQVRSANNLLVDLYQTNNSRAEGLTNNANKKNKAENQYYDQEYYEEDNPCASILDETKKPPKKESDDEADSINSLADSFPHLDAYSEVDSDLAPHVRIKRRETLPIKQRAAYLVDPIPSCIPREQRTDADAFEGKEFDDIAAYDSDAYINEKQLENIKALRELNDSKVRAENKTVTRKYTKLNNLISKKKTIRSQKSDPRQD